MENGLIYYTTKQGSGAATNKTKITAHYSGYLYNGQNLILPMIVTNLLM